MQRVLIGLIADQFKSQFLRQLQLLFLCQLSREGDLVLSKHRSVGPLVLVAGSPEKQRIAFCPAWHIAVTASNEIGAILKLPAPSDVGRVRGAGALLAALEVMVKTSHRTTLSLYKRKKGQQIALLTIVVDAQSAVRPCSGETVSAHPYFSSPIATQAPCTLLHDDVSDIYLPREREQARSNVRRSIGRT